jgi:hypothetical protein
MTLTVRDTTSGPTAVSAVALPAGAQAGDMMYLVAFRSGTATAPGLPAGWVSVANGGTNAVGLRVASRVKQAGDTTVASANSNGGYVIIAFVGDPAIATGDVVGGTGVGSPASVPALTLTDTDGSSRVLVAICHRDATNIDPIDGATDVVEITGNNAGSRLLVALTPLVTSWAGDASVPVTLAGVAAGQGWRSNSVEIIGPNASAASGGGSFLSFF